MRLRVGTRGSALALAQATDVAGRLERAGSETTIEIITTAGDRIVDRPFAEVGSVGVFARELELALTEGRIDVAVHSYKDLPSRGPEDLIVAAVPERLDPADVMVIGPGAIDRSAPVPIRSGARVGTASARRRALLKDVRPDLAVEFLRGNVPTRVRAVTEGRLDAVVLAAAGLLRLGRTPDALPLAGSGAVVERLDPDVFVPAPAQGALAVQTRRGDRAVRDAVAAIHDPGTTRALAAERAVLALAEGGCSLPFGAWCAVAADGGLVLVAAIERDDGRLIRARAAGRQPDDLARTVWGALTAREPG